MMSVCVCGKEGFVKGGVKKRFVRQEEREKERD
jgi:hypothetical protein